jgi:hypothetical protein
LHCFFQTERWYMDSDGVVKVTSTSFTAPGTLSEGSLYSCQNTTIASNRAGQVVFEGFNQFAERGVFGWTRDFGLFSIVVPGTQVEVEPGLYRTVLSARLFNPFIGGTQSDSLSADGVIPVLITFNDNRTGSIVRVRFNSLFARYQRCPSFSRQPAGSEVIDGQSVELQAFAVGEEPLEYKWLRDGEELSDGPTGFGSALNGVHASQLEIDRTTSADGGFYSVRVSNPCGVLESTAVIIGVRCLADFNLDGGVDGSDVDAFFSAWSSGDSSADLDGNGGVDGADISPFFAAWEAGC